MPQRNPVVNLIVNLSRKYGVDPQAALAVASVEGGHRWGAVGDQGTSFGPFQLHVGGALPRGRGAGWANSPAGVEYALRQIARVSRGKRGRAAVEAIVRQFERPAAPEAEIAKALSRYGGQPSVALGGLTEAPGGIQPGGQAYTRSVPLFSPLLAGVLQSNSALLGAPAPDFASLLTTKTVPGRTPAPVAPGAKVPKFKRGKTIRFIEHFAAPYGLTVTSTTGGHHVKGSWHYKGRAVDFGGEPSRMMALAQSALNHPRDFKEMFYDPAGFYIKNGKVYKGSIGGHSDHVHIAA